MVEQTLEQRGEVYGSYRDGIELRAKIMTDLNQHHKDVTGVEMNMTTQVAFGDLVMKLVRAAGKPSHTDSFHDLAGYATLIEEVYND